jgi:glycerol-3-phosphate acyltransferase PlsY
MQVALIVVMAFIFCLIGYAFGSIMFGVIIARLFNKDIRNVGSRNPGATNVSRTLNKKLALVVSLLDALKGYIAIIVC